MMTHKKILVAASLLLTSLLHNACQSEYLEDVNPVCFERDVQPIIASNCTQSGCHNSQDRESGYDFTSYEKIVSKGVSPGNYRASKLYQCLVSPVEQMPPSRRLSDEQVTLIAMWIQQGAKKTSCAATVCDTSNVTFSQTINPILQKNCTNGCHSGNNPSGNISYGSYNGVKESADNGGLLGSIEHRSGYSAMPENSAKLSNCDISLVQKWIAAGAPNN